MNIRLEIMTNSLCHKYLQEYTHDPDLFMENQPFTPYVYTREKAEAYWQRQQALERVNLLIMRGEEPIGEIVLKNIDHASKECTLGISMKNDSWKNQGYGTAAERMALEYAFDQLGMNCVLADALLKNKRSQHVLEKVGFRKTHQDGAFCYYRCDRDSWHRPEEG